MDVYDFRDDEDTADMTNGEVRYTRIAHFVTGLLVGAVVTFTAMAIVGVYLG